MEELINQKIDYIDKINKARYEISMLKEKKCLERKNAWANANGTAKEKEDFVKAQVADVDREISEHEADIEWYYNMVGIVNDKLVLTDE